MITRRKFFTSSALAASGLAGFPHLAKSAEALQTAPGQKPGRIIHLVADGMSLGTLTCADYLSHRVRHYTQLAGIEFKNPDEPLLAASGPEAADVENLAEYAVV